MRAIGRLLLIGMAAAVLPMQEAGAAGPGEPAVIEVVTFKLKPGITAAVFKSIDKQVQTQHVARQPGFVARESAAGANGEWLVIVHWRSAKDADASMASFEKAPAASEFMSKIDAATMNMKRYQKQ